MATLLYVPTTSGHVSGWMRRTSLPNARVGEGGPGGDMATAPEYRTRLEPMLPTLSEGASLGRSGLIRKSGVTRY